jgi:hypothetical protein
MPARIAGASPAGLPVRQIENLSQHRFRPAMIDIRY